MNSQNTTTTIMDNSTDSSDSTKYYVGVWYTVMSTLGLALVMPVLVTTIKLNGTKMTPFYMFLTNLCIADAALFCLYIFYVVPCVVQSSQVYGVVGDFSVMGLLESVIFITIVCNSFVISFNRFLCICFTDWEPIAFTRNSSLIMAVSTWCVGLSVNLLNIVMSCVTTFNEKKYTFSTTCSKITGSLSFGSFIIYFCVYGVAICYALIARKLWKQKKKICASNQQIAQNMSKRQMNMFFQALCIWLSLLSNAIGKSTADC